MTKALGTLGWSFDELEVVQGRARGVDLAAEAWARARGRKCTPFPADWNRHGKRAGILRNVEMAEYGDGLLAFWDWESRGTAHMIKTMKQQGKPTLVIRISGISRPKAQV